MVAKSIFESCDFVLVLFLAEIVQIKMSISAATGQRFLDQKYPKTRKVLEGLQILIRFSGALVPLIYL